jgi:hypothetical protein
VNDFIASKARGSLRVEFGRTGCRRCCARAAKTDGPKEGPWSDAAVERIAKPKLSNIDTSAIESSTLHDCPAISVGTEIFAEWIHNLHGFIAGLYPLLGERYGARSFRSCLLHDASLRPGSDDVLAEADNGVCHVRQMTKSDKIALQRMLETLSLAAISLASRPLAHGVGIGQFAPRRYTT